MAKLIKNPHLRLVGGMWRVFTYRGAPFPVYEHKWFARAANYARLEFQSRLDIAALRS